MYMSGVAAVVVRYLCLHISWISFPQSINSACSSHSFNIYWVSIVYQAPLHVMSLKQDKVQSIRNSTN